MNLDGHVVLLNGPELVAFDPPSREPLWRLKPLFDDHRTLPEGADDRLYWHCRLPAVPYKPGQLLLPMQNKELLVIDLHADNPVRKTLLSNLPAEITGNLFFEEHSMLAGKSLLALALADGTVRCYDDFEKIWAATVTAGRQNAGARRSTRRKSCGAKVRPRDSSRGADNSACSAPAEPCRNSIRFRATVCLGFRFNSRAMSPHSGFFDRRPMLTASPRYAVQRNGRVIMMDLDQKLDSRAALWELPPRQGMEESVSVTIDDSGVYVATRKNDGGELRKYKRHCDPGATAPTVLWSTPLDGHWAKPTWRWASTCT